MPAQTGQPSGDAVSAAALTGPPTAALPGRAASRAERRWPHTAKPPVGGGWGRQGAASVGARCRAHGGKHVVPPAAKRKPT